MEYFEELTIKHIEIKGASGRIYPFLSSNFPALIHTKNSSLVFVLVQKNTGLQDKLIVCVETNDIENFFMDNNNKNRLNHFFNTIDNLFMYVYVEKSDPIREQITKDIASICSHLWKD